MADRIDPDRLDLVLASVGQHLVVEAIDEAGAFDGDRPAVWRRRLLVAAAVLLAVTVAVASIAPARRVVSGWLRAGNIDVEVDPDLTVAPDLPAFVDDVASLDEGPLAARLGQPVPDLSGSLLGLPQAWWSPPERGILATWNRDSTSLWIVETIDTYPASLDKWLHEPQAATSVPDLGEGGYVVEGEHIFQTPFRIVAANSVVAWTDGELTFRLDSTMPADELLEVARSIADA
jgi:hypothetical protein